MFSPFKSLFIAGVLVLTPYSGGASGFVSPSDEAPQAALDSATTNAPVTADEADRRANPWALAGLLLAVMALGASRRRHG